MSSFCVRAGCQIRLVSFGSKHVSQGACDKPFVYTYTHNLITTGHMWMFSVSNYCSTIGDIAGLVWYTVGIQFLWYNIVCVYCEPLHTCFFFMSVEATLSLERLPVNFQESISISGWDFQGHRNVAGLGTPWQLKPMCPHIRRALPTTSSLVQHTNLTHWHWDSVLDFIQVLLKLMTQGFLKLSTSPAV